MNEFKVGELVVRTCGEYKKCLQYRNNEKEPHSVKMVGTLQLHWRGENKHSFEPSFGEWIECGKNGERTGSGNLITFEKATPQNIAELIQWWDFSSYTPLEWISEMTRYKIPESIKTLCLEAIMMGGAKR